MTDRRTEEGRSILLCYGEEGELRVEVDELLADYLLHIAACSSHCSVEALLQILVALSGALTVTRR